MNNITSNSNNSTSFSGRVKNELCRQKIENTCCVLAEAYGILMYCHTFSSECVKIKTESPALFARLPKLFRRAFGVEFDVRSDRHDGGKQTAVISNPQKLRTIFDAFGAEHDGYLAHHVNLAVLEEKGCKAAFIRGAFLAGGSVTDPNKRYHLELVTAHYNVNLETQAILLDLSLTPKTTERGGNHIIYLKQSKYIEDFLTTVGAPSCSLELMSTKAEKDMRNVINRKVNCDTANLSKMVSAAMAQTEAICRIRDSVGFDGMSEELRRLAELRLNNPEASLAELAELSEPPVTKSCLYHRMKKLMNYSTEQGD